MNTPQPIPAIAIEGETFASEFLLNRAKMIHRRNGEIIGTQIQNPDGSYTVTWVDAPVVVKVLKARPSNLKGSITLAAAYHNTFSPGASHN
jgi:hypothetical protein